jgi:hypothetical protein
MAYVHGHARRLGWVVGHYRRPQRAGVEQLALALPDAAPAIPAPRVSPEVDELGDIHPGATADRTPADQGQTGACRSLRGPVCP